MPGKTLSQEEKKLLHLWENKPDAAGKAALRSIEISGEPGLRGISSLIIPFRYPLTAICGNNGSGKSTVLAIAALAFHSPPNWFVHWGNPGNKRTSGGRTYYTFPDFFVFGKDEKTPDDVTITWRFFLNKEEFSNTFIKEDQRWGRYSKRPERETDFLPLARIVPARELSAVRTVFKDQNEQPTIIQLNEQFLKRLSFVMGKKYSLAEIQEAKSYTFQRCSTDSFYTAFNMGGGEYCAIELLHLLQRMPCGGFLVIEEIEAGLHPQAQKRLAETLISICLEKQIQIICSTHSEIFLDALPRQARLVLKKSGEAHAICESPSTRFAMYEMTGRCFHELIIYCEDYFAKILIEEALTAVLRLRVIIKYVGSDVNVIRQGIAHLRTGFEMRSLCVLDGDCSEQKIRKWINSETETPKNDLEPEFLLLPGDNLVPERWIVAQYDHTDYQREFAKQFACSLPDARTHIEAIKVSLDHHDTGHILHQRTNLDKNDCIRRLIRAVAPIHPQLDELREKVMIMLD